MEAVVSQVASETIGTSVPVFPTTYQGEPVYNKRNLETRRVVKSGDVQGWVTINGGLMELAYSGYSNQWLNSEARASEKRQISSRRKESVGKVFITKDLNSPAAFVEAETRESVYGWLELGYNRVGAQFDGEAWMRIKSERW